MEHDNTGGESNNFQCTTVLGKKLNAVIKGGSDLSICQRVDSYTLVSSSWGLGLRQDHNYVILYIITRRVSIRLCSRGHYKTQEVYQKSRVAHLLLLQFFYIFICEGTIIYWSLNIVTGDVWSFENNLERSHSELAKLLNNVREWSGHGIMSQLN